MEVIIYGDSDCGGMAEWLKAAVLKTASREPGRGFESYSLRQPTLKLRLASHE